jgi:hypothetical protein
MSHISSKLHTVLLVIILLLTACGTSDEQEATPGSAGAGLDTETTESAESEAGSGEEALAVWLQQVNSGEIESESIGESLDWGLGYLIYYGSLESLGVDNLIYNALEVHRRLDTGEVTQDNLSQAEQNLLQITEGIEYNSDVALTEQIEQTPEAREAILEHMTQSQRDLSPQEALDSNNVVGIVAPPAPESIGSKYLVYGQESPDADFTFLGVVIAADATSQANREPYSVGEWEGLPWLGDAAGPFWEDLPAGASGDPANTEEGRPGVLLISEETFEEIRAGNFD